MDAKNQFAGKAAGFGQALFFGRGLNLGIQVKSSLRVSSARFLKNHKQDRDQIPGFNSGRRLLSNSILGMVLCLLPGLGFGQNLQMLQSSNLQVVGSARGEITPGQADQCRFYIRNRPAVVSQGRPPQQLLLPVLFEMVVMDVAQAQALYKGLGLLPAVNSGSGGVVGSGSSRRGNKSAPAAVHSPCAYNEMGARVGELDPYAAASFESLRVTMYPRLPGDTYYEPSKFKLNFEYAEKFSTTPALRPKISSLTYLISQASGQTSVGVGQTLDEFSVQFLNSSFELKGENRLERPRTFVGVPQILLKALAGFAKLSSDPRINRTHSKVLSLTVLETWEANQVHMALEWALKSGVLREAAPPEMAPLPL